MSLKIRYSNGNAYLLRDESGNNNIKYIDDGGAGSALTQTQTGGYTWLGDGSSSDKFRLDPSGGTNRIRGQTHSPYHSGWDSSNAPKWTTTTAGTLNISRTGWSSADQDSDHQIYKNGTLALTLSFNTTGTSTLSVSVDDVIEWRGGQYGSYQSDTYIINPELWIG